MDNTRPTQCQRLIDYMSIHGSVTQIEALSELGILRLASRISELRRKGYAISREMVTVTNRFNEKCKVASYKLIDQKEGA